MELIVSTFAFVKELGDFSYELSASDRVWDILFPDKGEKWHHLHVNKYTFYITHVDGGGGGLEVELKKVCDQWNPWEHRLTAMKTMVNLPWHGNH